MREGRVDVESLLRYLDLLLRRQVTERAHVVRAIGELDENDADVAGHGEDHLAEVLGLLLLARGEIDLADLGHAVDERGDLGSEDLLDLLDARQGVLHGVVEQAGGDRGNVELELGDDARDLERMGQIGLAGHALLSAVDLRRELVGAGDRVGVGDGVVGLDSAD